MKPWWSRLPSIALYPIASVRGVLGCLMLGVLAWIGVAVGRFGFISFTGAGVILGLVFSTVFAVIRESANGGTEMPEIGNVSNVREEVIIPGIKAAVLAALFLLPVWLALPSAKEAAPPAGQGGALGGMLSSLGVPPGIIPSSGGDDPTTSPSPIATASPSAAPDDAPSAGEGYGLAAFAVLVGFALFPLCLVVLALSRSLLAAVNPLVWGRLLGPVAIPYLGMLVGVLGIGGTAVGLSLLVEQLPVPLLGLALARIVQVYGLLAVAHLLGMFVWQYREPLGYVAEVRQEMNADRVRQIKEATLAEISRARPGLGGGAVSNVRGGATIYRPPNEDRGTLQARFQAACDARDLPAAAGALVPLADLSWQSGDPAAVMAAYRQIQGLDAQFSFDAPRQARLARTLEEASDLPLAAVAWSLLASTHPGHALAPRALYRSGDCYARAGQVPQARGAFEALLARHPQDESAGMAKSRLRAL